MCHPGMHHEHEVMRGCGCMSHCHHPHGRHFYTSEEVREHLESYKEHLEKELAGVKERIDELAKSE